MFIAMNCFQLNAGAARSEGIYAAKSRLVLFDAVL